MAYSIYLLHGMILFVTFRFVIGYDAAAALSPVMHWCIVLSCVPIVILISFLTYRLIERPGMMITPKFIRMLDQLPFNKKSS
jgi:peptidoglycan/LPS O-acetylase OafA/YrhL